jgi:hypothetical protein
MQPLTERFQFLPVSFLLTFTRYSIDSQISQTAFGKKLGKNTTMSFLLFFSLKPINYSGSTLKLHNNDMDCHEESKTARVTRLLCGGEN